MVAARTIRILTINSGSSSVKIARYAMGPDETPCFTGSLSGIGQPSGRFQVKDAGGADLVDASCELPDHAAALEFLFAWLKRTVSAHEIDAIAHRIVQGGMSHRRPQIVTPALRREMEELVPLAPDHLPHELKAIDAAGREYPEVTQVACFDTAFHRDMPAIAQRYALPNDLCAKGLVRYGFHGLSYEYIVMELRKLAGNAADGRLILAHLGNGASMAAVSRGRSLDTTMGLTPAGGLVMSTRPGDLDPGVELFLQQELKMDPGDVNRLLNRHSGLLGISGLTSDMQELLACASENPQAAEAVALFCYQAKKYLGALAAVLGGLDTLVFTGGIGEHAHAIRQRICDGLAFLGITVDPEKNAANAPVISPPESPVTVRVMKTDEEVMMARHTKQLLTEEKGGEMAA